MPFKRSQRTPVPQQQKYSLDMVRQMLDHVGLYRLHVRDPKLKVLLTLIAQNGEEHLTARSGGVTPTDANIVQFQNLLEALLRVINQYVDVQDNPSRYPDAEKLLLSGFQATEGFATEIVSPDVPGGKRSLTDFKVDTNILSAQRHR